MSKFSLSLATEWLISHHYCTTSGHNWHCWRRLCKSDILLHRVNAGILNLAGREIWQCFWLRVSIDHPRRTHSCWRRVSLLSCRPSPLSAHCCYLNLGECALSVSLATCLLTFLRAPLPPPRGSSPLTLFVPQSSWLFVVISVLLADWLGARAQCEGWGARDILKDYVTKVQPCSPYSIYQYDSCPFEYIKFYNM